MDARPAPMVPAEVDLPRSRSDAVRIGAVRYFTGEACPNGHTAPRYTLGGYCVVCQREVTRANKAAAKKRRRAA